MDVLWQALVLDTPLAIFLWLLSFDFSQEEAFRQGLESYSFRHSVSDVVLMNFAKACLLCLFYSFAVLRPFCLVATLTATGLLLAKACLFDSWGPSDPLSSLILVLSLAGSIVEVLAVRGTKYTWEDPDWELAERLEAERAGEQPWHSNCCDT